MSRFLKHTAAVLLPLLAYLLMRFYWHTSRKHFHIKGEISEGQSIVVSWHAELLMSPQMYRHFHKSQRASAIVSKHFDGGIIAGMLGYFKINALRGSSSKGGRQVLLEAFRALKTGETLLITPDGPRGPRHSIADGAIALAMKSKAPIMILNYIPGAYWQLGSWDKFLIPKPFTPIDFYVENIYLDDMTLEEAKVFLKEKMLEHTVI